MSIQKMSQVADRLEASGVGYDQYQRWSWLDKANRTIISNREVDCSAGCGGIAWLAGYPVDIADPFYTGNFRQKMVAAGFDAISIRGKLLSEIVDLSREGDFLLGPGHVVYVRSKSRWWSAERDENGRKNGGKAGDQDGRETRFRAPYARSKGWEWIIRPQAQAVDADPLVATTPLPAPKPAAPTGYRNPHVPLAVDGAWGKGTTRALQHCLKVKYNAHGLKGPLVVDGVWGKNSIRALQRVLNQEGRFRLAEDGIAGPATRRALQNYLRVRVDGIWGPATHRALQTRLNNNSF
jgi:hypothetical protein